MELVKNKDLQCKNCFYRYDDSKIAGNTTCCVKYSEKPKGVLTKTSACNKYLQEGKERR